ncbi:MAG: hypothetical protein ACRCSK_01880 [Fusobacteriaceae bacterium]
MEKIIFAHRGVSSLAPENTLSAFRLCKYEKIVWFECDVDILCDDTIDFASMKKLCGLSAT